MATFRKQRKHGRFIDPEDAFKIIPEEGFSSTLLHQQAQILISVKFPEILTILKKELSDNQIYYVTWINAQAKYYKIKDILDEKNQGLPKLPKECHIAITAYTMELDVEQNLYADFNKRSRELNTEADWQSFPYKSFFALLARAIHGIWNNPDVNSETYYRGVDAQMLDLKEGDYVYSTQYMSSTISKDIAIEFMGDGHGTLITYSGSPLAACGIVEYSDFPEEEEILVFPWSTFKVTKLAPGAERDELFLESVGPYVHDFPFFGKYIKEGTEIDNS